LEEGQVAGNDVGAAIALREDRAGHFSVIEKDKIWMRLLSSKDS
jgi:hypothetical protein